MRDKLHFIPSLNQKAPDLTGTRETVSYPFVFLQIDSVEKVTGLVCCLCLGLRIGTQNDVMQCDMEDMIVVKTKLYRLWKRQQDEIYIFITLSFCDRWWLMVRMYYLKSLHFIILLVRIFCLPLLFILFYEFDTVKHERPNYS